MLEQAAQVASIFSAVLIPAALIISAVQTRFLKLQVREETVARQVQIYQSLHENMAQRVATFLEYPAYRSAFYEDQPVGDELDVSIAATLAEMTLDMLDTAAVAARALPPDLAAPWLLACVDIYWDSPYVREHWSVVRETYSSSLQKILPVPDPASADSADRPPE